MRKRRRIEKLAVDSTAKLTAGAELNKSRLALHNADVSGKEIIVTDAATISATGDTSTLKANTVLTNASAITYDVDALVLDTTRYDLLTAQNAISAVLYFSNLGNSNYMLTFSEDELGALSITMIIPEPGTTTMSPLALSLLVARRRRK